LIGGGKDKKIRQPVKRHKRAARKKARSKSESKGDYE